MNWFMTMSPSYPSGSCCSGCPQAVPGNRR